MKDRFKILVICILAWVMIVAPALAYAGDSESAFTGLKKGEDGEFYYFENGVWQEHANLLYRAASGTYYYVEGGMWKQNANRLFN